LQKCFTNIETDSENNFTRVKLFIQDILNMKDIFNMELGYAASMIYILVISLESEQSLTKSVYYKYIFSFFIYNSLIYKVLFVSDRENI
jgi:hypothetical protein